MLFRAAVTVVADRAAGWVIHMFILVCTLPQNSLAAKLSFQTVSFLCIESRAGTNTEPRLEWAAFTCLYSARLAGC